MKQSSPKAVVLFSGGVDSTTCLAMAIERFGRNNVIPLSIYYGQKHTKELEAAKNILEYYKIEGRTLDLTTIFAHSNSSLLTQSSESIPTGPYSLQQQKSATGVVSTYVPFRNGLFLSVAASLALSFHCSFILYGAHADDSAGNAYPDCSPTFFNAMRESIFEGSGRELTLEAPFIKATKKDVVKEGLRLRVPYELTWSCYAGTTTPCHVCGTCIDREKAFLLNGVKDPLGD